MSNLERYSVAAATLLLVIVGIWGVFETKGALEATQRAWITPIGANLLQQLQLDQGIRFAVLFINPGREPAIDIGFKIKSDLIDKYNTQFTSIDDVTVPENTSCDGLSTIKGRAIMSPSGGSLIAVGWNFDSRHSERPFLVDDEILNGRKFYVVSGCAAYNTYSKPHKTSFCYILERRAGIQQTGPPNVVYNPAPPQNLSNNISGLLIAGLQAA